MTGARTVARLRLYREERLPTFIAKSEPTVPMMVRVTVEDLAQMDAWIAQNGPSYVTRPEAVRRLVRSALAKASCEDRPD